MCIWKDEVNFWDRLVDNVIWLFPRALVYIYYCVAHRSFSTVIAENYCMIDRDKWWQNLAIPYFPVRRYAPNIITLDLLVIVLGEKKICLFWFLSFISVFLLWSSKVFSSVCMQHAFFISLSQSKFYICSLFYEKFWQWISIFSTFYHVGGC